MAQTYDAVGNAIPDYGEAYYPMSVTGLSSNSLYANIGLLEVCVDIVHTWSGDLEIYIVAPDGTEVLLSENNGGPEDNYSNTCFNTNASTLITDGTAPFNGSYIPEENLGFVNNGQNGNGTWQLLVKDEVGSDVGTLLTWSLTFGSNAAAPYFFESSNLPLVFINTNGQSIQDEPDILVEVGIIDNGEGNRNYLTDAFNDYNGYGKIEFRGQTSQGFPKKNYALELSDINGNDIDASLLGLPEEEDWILHGPYSDKTLMRNHLSMKISREMGWYASRTKHLELFINNEYKGVYVLMEKIKRDENRLDLAKLKAEDIDGDELTGGYIIKIDKGDEGGWYSDYNIPSYNNLIYFQYVYPKVEDIQEEQKDYIQDYIKGFEDALVASNYTNNQGKHYTDYVDLQSFVDYFIVNELSKNVDAYRISTYLHKEKITKSGQLIMGPVWDFNIAWYNADYCSGDNSTGWVFDENCGDNMPFWWSVFINEPQFQQLLKCRWNHLRGNILSESELHNHIDTMALFLNEAQARNFVEWDILGDYLWPNPSAPSTYQGEINNLKDWITNRLSWMDNVITTMPDGGVNVNLNVSACESYTSPSGNYTWTSSGTYNDIVSSNIACDTTFVINLDIVSLDNSLTINNNSLTANLANATYQWLDCNNGNAIINGENNQVFTPLMNGLYAVEITKGGCTTMSDCYAMTTLSTHENISQSSIVLYPNPTKQSVFIDLGESFEEITARLLDVTGRVINVQDLQNTQHFQMDITGSEGLYLLEIQTTNGGKAIMKILKN